MEFRLIYQGKLPAAGRTNTRTVEKHDIRRVFHQQLAELWRTHPQLKWTLTPRPIHTPEAMSAVERAAESYRRCGYRFVPLIGGTGGFFGRIAPVACSLDILFLRRDGPGNVIVSGGDIDNRIKVLFDALHIPDDCAGIIDRPRSDEDPFFCLLTNDDLITEVKITTDRLIIPLRDDEHIHDVHLVIHVRVIFDEPS